VTPRARTATLVLVAALVIAAGGFLLGKATGSSGSGTTEARALEPTSDAQASAELAKLPAAPPMRARPGRSDDGSGATGTAEAAAPQAEAPAATPQAPVTQSAPPQQPAAQQPENPVAGE
jgi:hypothetical protein